MNCACERLWALNDDQKGRVKICKVGRALESHDTLGEGDAGGLGPASKGHSFPRSGPDPSELSCLPSSLKVVFCCYNRKTSPIEDLWEVKVLN
jgi:hypothetical protein